MNVWETTVVRASGMTAENGAASAVLAREKVLLDTQAAEDAVLRPRQSGAFSHAVRAALAARIARLNGEAALAETYLQGFEGDAHAGLAPAVVSFMDRVAASPKDIRAEDIEALQRAGIGDADIVRLCELNAFLAYEIRVIAGLRLMAEMA